MTVFVFHDLNYLRTDYNPSKTLANILFGVVDFHVIHSLELVHDLNSLSRTQ